jgi:hypothetical protein
MEFSIPLDAQVRCYQADTGEEYEITAAYMKDGILCLDITPTGTITPDADEL